MLARRIYNPFDLATNELDRLFNGLRGEVPAQLAPYAVDVHEDADHFYVTAELPGFTEKEIDVHLEDGVLSINAQRNEEKKADRGALHVERRWTQFQRSFTLPTAINENTVKAQLDAGVLTVTLDKREEVKPRKIQVTASAPTIEAAKSGADIKK
jgi:HSP20 family protein